MHGGGRLGAELRLFTRLLSGPERLWALFADPARIGLHGPGQAVRPRRQHLDHPDTAPDVAVKALALAEAVHVREQAHDVLGGVYADKAGEPLGGFAVIGPEDGAYGQQGAELVARQVPLGVVAGHYQRGVVLAPVVDLLFDKRLALHGPGEGQTSSSTPREKRRTVFHVTALVIAVTK